MFELKINCLLNTSVRGACYFKKGEGFGGAELAGRGAPDPKGAGLNREISLGPKLG